MPNHTLPTPIQRDILAIAHASGLTGPALARHVAQDRGIRLQTANNHLDKMAARGFLTSDYSTAPVLAALREADILLGEAERILCEREWPVDLRDRVIALRRVIYGLGGTT